MGKGCGLPRAHGGLTHRRRVPGFALALLLPPLLTLALVAARPAPEPGQRRPAVPAGGRGRSPWSAGSCPALVAAVGGSLLLNYFFTPPLHTFTIRETNNVLALGVFVVVAALVSSVVDLAARRTRQAARATRRGGDPGHAGRQRAARRDGRCRPCWTACGRRSASRSVTLLENAAAADGRPRRRCTRPGRRVDGRGQRRRRPAPSAPRTPTPRSPPATPSCSPCAGGRCTPRTNASSTRSPPRPPSLLERQRLAEAAAAAEPLAEARPDAHRAARRGQPRPAHARSPRPRPP